MKIYEVERKKKRQFRTLDKRHKRAYCQNRIDGSSSKSARKNALKLLFLIFAHTPFRLLVCVFAERTAERHEYQSKNKTSHLMCNTWNDVEGIDAIVFIGASKHFSIIS